MTFVAWLRQHQHARSAIGDLARDALRDPERLWTLRHKQAWATVHLKQSDRFWRSQLPNAAARPRLEAGAQRTLEAVSSRPLIMYEAPSPAYPRVCYSRKW